MADTTHVDGTTVILSDWLNDVNRVVYTIGGDPADVAALVGAIDATQAQQETGTSTGVVVTPGVQKYHPSAAKAWVKFQPDGTILASFNVASIVDNGAGDFTVNFSIAFSSVNYCAVVSCTGGSPVIVCSVGSQAAASCGVNSRNASTNALADSSGNYHAAFFGDQ